jgi:aryl-alcohol dehydrogenase (NADP+)
MEHVPFGSTGLVVSRLCVGTATFGIQCDEPTSHAILDAAAAQGFTFIDTADKYPLGGSPDTAGVTESIVGRWLRGRRDDFIIATKFHGRTGPQAWAQGASRKHILDAVDASLRRLGTDYIDLYQIHRPDQRTPIEETLSALTDCITAGKLRYIGCSNFLAYQLARALGRSDVLRLSRFVSVQPRYNLLFREVERELLPLCGEEGLAVMPYNVLAGGLLTGKHTFTEAPPSGTRFQLATAAALYQNRYWEERKFRAVEAIGHAATECGIPMATLATAWVAANEVVTSLLVGASHPDQLTPVVQALDIKIDPELKDQLDSITAEFRYGDAVE